MDLPETDLSLFAICIETTARVATAVSIASEATS